MIKTFTAQTFEIDDTAAAADEILRQIDSAALLANSVGIISCFTDFVDSGAAKAVCEALPFDVIGITTTASAVPEDYGELMLSLLVLTSDDVEFRAGRTGSLMDDLDGPIEKAYKEAGEGKPEKPALMLTFAPFINTVGGEAIVDSINKVTGNIQLYGTFTTDSTSDFHLNQTIYRGEAFRDAVTFALLYGDIHPSYCVAAVPEEKIQKQKGIITKSKGNLLMEVNDMKVTDYLNSLGFDRSGGAWSTLFFPFVINYNDGTKPLVRSIYTITPEGYAACGGHMPEGSTLAIAGIDYADVIRTAKEALEGIRSKKGDCLLLVACCTRYMVLGANSTAELKTVQDILGDSIGYQFSYSGGEICPVYTESGEPVNRFHNCTFTACLI